MTIPVSTGYFESSTNTYYPSSTSTWDGLDATAWDDWNVWPYETESQIVVHMPVIRLDDRKNFCLNFDTESTGTVSYKIYTSPTGAYAGEETEHVINPGDINIPSFYGWTCFIVVIADKAGPPLEISSMSGNIYDSVTNEIIFTALDSSTLDGSITERLLPLNTSISKIVDMKITPHETASPYNLDVYVTNTPTSTYLIPKIISTSSTAPSFALVGVDNQPRDGVVDILLKVLPEQYMDGNNLKTR